MKLFTRNGPTLVAAALLAGCGGSQPPIGAPDAMQQGRPPLTRDASGNNLIYATSADLVSAYDFSGNLMFNLKNLYGVRGLCSDASGNVFIPVGGLVYEYAHGGTQPIAVLTGASHSAFGCAVDPITGNLAVTSTANSHGAGNVAVYEHAQGVPQVFTDPDIHDFIYCGYDNAGNLFVDGATGGKTYLSELLSGGSGLAKISLDKRVQRAGAVQWDGQYLSMGDSYDHLVYQISVSGTTGTVVGTSAFKGWAKRHGIVQYWLSNGTILIPYHHKKDHGVSLSLGIWKYPGGNVLSKFALHYCCQGGVTVSVGARGLVSLDRGASKPLDQLARAGRSREPALRGEPL